MEEGSANPATSAAGPSAAQQAAQQQQQLLLQQQLFMMQQQQAQAQAQQRPRAPHMPQQQANSLQQAMARFPSNIDAHLRAPGFRSMQFAQAQLQQQQQQMAARSAAAAGAAGAPPSAPPTVRNPEIEMALQDAFKVCNPDVKTPFSSIEDAVNRLLPYHVVSDYEAEEDDRAIESDKTGQAPSRLQQWDHNILVKIAEFTSTFEKQVLAFNIMTRKRALGEFRSEERLHLEQSLLQNEKRIALETRADIEARQKVAAAAQMAASAAVQADMMGAARPPAPMRGHAASLHGEDAQDQEAVRQGGWSGNAGNSGVNATNGNDNENGDNNNNNNGEEEEEGDEDFLNNEENGDDEADDSGGELDLNAR